MKLYLTADEIAKALGISKGHAYAIIRKCNEELKQEGFICIQGRVSAKYFAKKYYGYAETALEN